MNADFSSRFESDHARNLIGNAAARYYWRWLPDWLLYVSLSGTVTHLLPASGCACVTRAQDSAARFQVLVQTLQSF